MINRLLKYLDITLLKRILAFTKPYKKIFSITLVLIVIMGLLAPVRPYLIKYMVDEFIPTKNKEMLYNFAILLVAILIFESLLQYAQIYLANHQKLHVKVNFKNF